MVAEFWLAKTEGQRHFRCNDNIKMDLEELYRKGGVSILAYDRDKLWAFVNTVMSVRVT